MLTEEAARVLQHLGAEVKIYSPSGLPLVGDANDTHDKVQELRNLSLRSEAHVWCSPERHGAMTGLMKTQIDWLPLAPIGGVRPTQGRTLALMQVCGGSQSFNTVNQLRILGRWMRMITIPNQSPIGFGPVSPESGNIDVRIRRRYSLTRSGRLRAAPAANTSIMAINTRRDADGL